MHIGYRSTAYSIGTVYRGTGRLYTSDVCPALLATPCIASLATPCIASLATPRCPGRPNYPNHPDYPNHPINGAQLATPS
jgi:hypothetical protein